MNTPVKFELAKLLKEKGFDKSCKYYYSDEDLIEAYHNRNHNDSSICVTSAPTIAEVVMWLYEKHWIWIQPYQTDDNNDAYPLFWGEINNRGKIIESTKFGNWFNSPTEAYEAAIGYILNNLI